MFFNFGGDWLLIAKVSHRIQVSVDFNRLNKSESKHKCRETYIYHSLQLFKSRSLVVKGSTSLKSKLNFIKYSEVTNQMVDCWTLIGSASFISGVFYKIKPLS